MISSSYPLISCLCLTRNRPGYLKRAIDCFHTQHYANKELVVLIGKDDSASLELLEQMAADNIKTFQYDATAGIPLGEVRNMSIANASGEYICQWDDDDWYHADRLGIQYQYTIENGKSGTIMAMLLIYDTQRKQVYLSPHSAWPQTIFCKRSLTGAAIRYPPLNKNEDTMFISKLLGINALYPVLKPWLYLYTYHGGNTYQANHFNKIFSTCQTLSKQTSLLVSSILQGEIPAAEASSKLSSVEMLNEINYLRDWSFA